MFQLQSTVLGKLAAKTKKNVITTLLILVHLELLFNLFNTSLNSMLIIVDITVSELTWTDVVLKLIRFASKSNQFSEAKR